MDYLEGLPKGKGKAKVEGSKLGLAYTELRTATQVLRISE